ncbi:MAG: hypothetical protein Q8N99_01335 [Nanoarchaeota archaeon]|nr:hypothetical protein [Nanoarchaeota archaeon]
MFNRKCSRCNNKVNKEFDYCPFCGNNLISESDKTDYGFIGKNDFIDDNSIPINNSPMDKILENAFKMAEKMLDKHMKALSEEMVETRQKNFERNEIPNRPSRINIQCLINGENAFPNTQEKRVIKPVAISKEKIDKIAKLPKKEPNSKVRRFSGKVVYELEVPGVNSINDVLINQLENSIEIKALTKDKVYSKTLNINLPILGYKLKEGNLVLELLGK